MEYTPTKTEREAILKAREEKSEKQYKKGKIIVSSIAITYIIFTVIASIMNFNILGLIINIAVAIALFFGIKWVRYFYAFTVGVGMIIFLIVIFNKQTVAMVPQWAIIMNIIQLVIGITGTVLLFKSQSVIEFMEYQRESPY